MADRRRSAEDFAAIRNVVGAAATVAGGGVVLSTLVGAGLEVKVALASLALLGLAGAMVLGLLEWRVGRHAASAVFATEPSEQGRVRTTASMSARPREGPVVFVSASTEDEEWRRRFVDMLRPLMADRGLGVWSDERGLPEPSKDELEEATARSRAALLLVSERFMTSRRIDHEIGALRAHNVPLLAVLIENCAWENVNTLKGVRWWRDSPFAPVKNSQLDHEMQEIVYACMKLRDRLPDIAVGIPTVTGTSPSVAVAAPRSGPLTAGKRSGELYDVPSLPLGFVAREELDRLRAAVLGAGDGAVGITGRAVGLHGQGGIGKTVLATALARDGVVLEHFPDGVFWVTIGQHADLVSTQRGLLARMGVAYRELRSVAQGAALLAEALSDLRCLLVVDDVWSTAAAKAFRPVGFNGRVLYTTRDRAVLESVGADVQHIDVLPEQVARELLDGVSEMPLNAWPGEIDRILAATGRVALALALVGATAGRGRTWRDVADKLERAGETFLDHPYADTFKAMQVGVSALNEDLARAYASLAVYPEDTRVPVAAVVRLWSVVHDLSVSVTFIRLQALADRALLSFDGDAITFHDLQREFLLLQARDLTLLHDDLLTAYRALLPSPDSPWRQLPRDELYIWSHLLYHLQEGGDRHGVRSVARDLGFVALRCFRGGPWAVESDLRIAQTVHPDDPAIAWLLGLFCEAAFLFTGHVAVENLAATLASRTGSAPRGIDVGALSELLPDVVPLVRREHDAPEALVRALTGRARSVRAIAYGPSGDQLASGNDDGTVRLWDPATGKQTATLEGHTRGIRDLAFAPSGNQLASASDDGTVRLWDPATGNHIGTLAGHAGEVREVAYAPSGDVLASVGFDRTVRLWDSVTGRQTALIEGHTRPIRSMAHAPSGDRLASGDDGGTIRLWDPATGEQTAVIEAHSRPVRSMAYSPSGERLASGDQGGTVRLWDPATGRLIATLTDHALGGGAVAYAPSGDQLASGNDDGTVRLWDPATGEQTATLGADCGGVRAVAYAPSGDQLASGNDDGTVRLWDPATGDQTATLQGHTGWVRAAAYAPSGKWLARAGSDETVRVCNTATGEETATLEGHTGWVRTVAYAPSGEQLASGGDDGTVRLWDPATGRQIATLEGHTGCVWAVAYAPSGEQLASGGGDGAVRLWGSSQRRRARSRLDLLPSRRIGTTLIGHSGEVFAVAFAPDGRLIASGSGDGTVRLWDDRGASICCTRVGRSIAALTWDSDGIKVGVSASVMQIKLIDRDSLPRPYGRSA